MNEKNDNIVILRSKMEVARGPLLQSIHSEGNYDED